MSRPASPVTSIGCTVRVRSAPKCSDSTVTAPSMPADPLGDADTTGEPVGCGAASGVHPATSNKPATTITRIDLRTTDLLS